MGAPPRKYHVLGVIHDTRPDTPYQMSRYYHDIAAKVKQAGAMPQSKCPADPDTQARRLSLTLQPPLRAGLPGRDNAPETLSMLGEREQYFKHIRQRHVCAHVSVSRAILGSQVPVTARSSARQQEATTQNENAERPSSALRSELRLFSLDVAR